METYDITIIGAGPSGMFAAFYAGMRGAKTKIIDTLPQLGGQLATLYPEKYIYDIPGYNKIKAGDLVQNLEKQLMTFNHRYCLEQEVLKIEKLEDGSIEITTNQDTHYSKSVILALGSGSFHPRKLALTSAPAFENLGIDYYVHDLMKYAGKKVAVAGGGDSALDWALMLEPIAAEVSLIHRRTNFRGHEHTVAKLMASSVNVMTPFVIEECHGDHQLNRLVLKNPQEEETVDLAVDYLLVNYGFTSNLAIKDWGIDGSRRGIPVHSDMQTSIPGIYACGDIALYAGKVKLIATGFGEAPTAVNNALHYLNPKNRTQPGHSTSLFNE
ncbi:MAG: NAD(P)/FAD-dependent oxidoreductase [Enterococcus sp.]